MLGLLMVKPFLYWAQKSQTASLKRYRLQDDSQNCCCHIQTNTKLGVNTKVSIYRAYMLSALLCKEVANHGAPMLNNKDNSTTSTSTASLVPRTLIGPSVGTCRNPQYVSKRRTCTQRLPQMYMNFQQVGLFGMVTAQGTDKWSARERIVWMVN